MTGPVGCPALPFAPEQLLSYVVDLTDDAIITQSPDGIIMSWNGGAERLYGYSAEEVVGQPGTILDPEGRGVQAEQLLRRVLEGMLVDRFDTEKKRKDGQTVVVSQSMSPVRDAGGRIVAAATIARDVTER